MRRDQLARYRAIEYYGCRVQRETGDNRVQRGGSWNSNGRWLRAANRNNDHPDNRNNKTGFRLAQLPD